MAYQLNLAIKPADLQSLIDNNQQIIVIKSPFENGAVPWVSLAPALSNCIQWGDNYYLWAQMERVQPGSVVRMDYQTAALPGRRYNFQPFGSFFPSDGDGVQPTSYQVINLFTLQLYTTFGMAQPVQVNGSLAMVNPINAFVITSNNLITFSGQNRVTLFISNTIAEAELIPTAYPVNALVIDFALPVNEVNVIYDAETGGFVHAGL